MLTHEQMEKHLRAANQIAIGAVKDGHHPFGALLVSPDGETVLQTQGNVSTVKHAESELGRWAAENYSSEYLWECALVTTLEPCCMCAGTQYWANIGILVYGVAEEKLLELTGNHNENPTMNLPSRTVMSSGQKDIKVFGPFPELTDEIVQPHKDFWVK